MPGNMREKSCRQCRVHTTPLRGLAWPCPGRGSRGVGGLQTARRTQADGTSGGQEPSGKGTKKGVRGRKLRLWG